MNKITPIVAASALAICSCSVDSRYNAENLMNIDKSATLFQDGIEFPVGLTDKIKVSTILDLTGLDDEYIEQGEDGSLTISANGSEILTPYLDSLNLKSIADLDGVSYTIEPTRVDFDPILDSLAHAGIPLTTVAYNLSYKKYIRLLKAGNLPDGIVELTEADLDDCYLYFSLKFNGLPDLGDDVQYRFIGVATLPECLRPTLVNISGTVDDNGLFTADPINLTKITGSYTNKDDIGGDLLFVGRLSASADWGTDVSSLTGPITATGSVVLGNPEGKIVIDELHGSYDGKLTASSSIDLSDLPQEFMDEDNVLDINGTSMSFTLTTNLDLPADIDLHLSAWKDNIEGKTVNVTGLAMPQASSPYLTDSLTYDLPGEEIAALLKEMPDSITISVTATTNPDEEFIIYPDVRYTLKVSYNVEQPLSVGPDFMFNYSQDVDFDSSVLEEYKGLTAGLKLYIDNTIPLNLDAMLEFVDAEGNILDITENKLALTVNAGKGLLNTSDATTTTTNELMLNIKENAAIESIAKIRIHWSLDAADSQATISAKDYVRASIAAVLPEGITINTDNQ